MADAYRVTQIRPTTDRDPETHKVVEGYAVHALDHETASPVEVFVPRDKATPENVHAQVMHEIGKVRAIKQLPGGIPTTG